MMRDVLIEHLDARAVPIVVGDANRQSAVAALIQRGWIRPSLRKFNHTVITDDGRQALARALADWAEALIRAGFSVESQKPAKPRAHAPGTSNVPTLPLDSP